MDSTNSRTRSSCINFVVAYNWQESEKTWSGTPYSLSKALQKKCEIKDVNIGVNRLEFALSRFAAHTIYRGRYFFMEQQFQDYKLKKADIAEQNNLVIGGDTTTPMPHTWLYLDDSVGHLCDVREHSTDMFSKGAFTNVSEGALHKWKYKQDRTFCNIEGIFTMSRWLEDYLVYEQQVPCKVRYAGGGYNVESLGMDSGERQGNKILFVGRDFVRKGGELVIEAFRRLKAKMPNAELYIVGGWNGNAYMDGVYCVGNLDLSEVHHYFQTCDVFCMPSYYEAWGIVFVEALVAGLPCIGRNRFEMPRMIEPYETGFLIDDDNADVLAQYMYELLTNPRYKTKVASRREYYLHEYSWDTVADRILAGIYNTNVNG